jgi:hypothetical protein
MSAEQEDSLGASSKLKTRDELERDEQKEKWLRYMREKRGLSVEDSPVTPKEPTELPPKEPTELPTSGQEITLDDKTKKIFDDRAEKIERANPIDIEYLKEGINSDVYLDVTDRENFIEQLSKYGKLVITIDIDLDEKAILSQISSLVTEYDQALGHVSSLKENMMGELERLKKEGSEDANDDFWNNLRLFLHNKFGEGDVTGIEEKLLMLKGAQYFLTSETDFDRRLFKTYPLIRRKEKIWFCSKVVELGPDKIENLYKRFSEGEEIPHKEKGDLDSHSIVLCYKFMIDPRGMLPYDDRIDLAVDYLLHYNDFYNALIDTEIVQEFNKLIEPYLQDNEVEAVEAPVEEINDTVDQTLDRERAYEALKNMRIRVKLSRDYDDEFEIYS